LTDFPIRYDFHLIATLDTEVVEEARQLRSWINAINAHALSISYPALQKDFKQYNNLYQSKETGRQQNVFFLYARTNATRKKMIVAKPLETICKDFRAGKIKPEEQIGRSVIFDLTSEGKAKETRLDIDSELLTPPDSTSSSIVIQHVGVGAANQTFVVATSSITDLPAGNRQVSTRPPTTILPNESFPPDHVGLSTISNLRTSERQKKTSRFESIKE